ncbi:hypothetical protein BDN72DRAFT_900137 [Pluteus cervinus]|uniref:Uncharacterized protein n=1 Tax=Pluteus cervinus TaxID=181527 RepID=A0ACD3AKL3_9AGAR|nr:hypothetical protein BDN72DRAFT_900137 [Pluteus cervinus]
MLFATPLAFLTVGALLAGGVSAELLGRNSGYGGSGGYGGGGGGGGGGTSDTCGEVNSPLKVPNPHQPGKYTTVGTINACICKSGLPNFITSNSVAISGVALAGNSYVNNAIGDLLNSCGGRQTCSYPPNAVPTCQSSNPCYFSCKNGFVATPSNHPTQCTCPKPYTLCNGQCGTFRGCPSAHPYKRDEYSGHKSRQFECHVGLSACGILGRGPKAWECVDTQHDLESCGGCVMPLAGDLSAGQDCTALPGVSDVSCISGKCVVHRCDAGYEAGVSGDHCEYVEDTDPIRLAIQYGLANAI